MTRKRKNWRLEHKKSGVLPLNKKGHHSVACVSWKVSGNLSVTLSQDETQGGEERPWLVTDVSNSINGGITISDCNKSVHLDLDCYNQEAVNNSLEKMDRLIDELKRCRVEFKKAVKIFKEGKEYEKLEVKSMESPEKITEIEAKELLNKIKKVK